MKRNNLKKATYPTGYNEQIRVDERPIKGSKALITSGAVWLYGGGAGSGYKVDKLDFSYWDDGLFLEELEGEYINLYRVTFDANNRPIKFIDATGNETTITW